jgi:single-strand DNA-binding protein
MHGDVTVTLSGFVATTPTLFTSPSGTDFTSFRIAQTRRYVDRERGEWVDGRTVWFTVKSFRHAARNVATSLHKGDPVVVTGRLSVDEWAGQDGPRTSLVVEATSLGHDLVLGESRFARTVHRRDDGGEGARGAAGGSRDAGDGRTTAPGTAAGDDDPWERGEGALDATTGDLDADDPDGAAHEDEPAEEQRLAAV